MQVTCPGCFLNYAVNGPAARCPACGAAAPPPTGYGQYGAGGPPGGSFGQAPANAWGGGAAAAPSQELVISTTFVVLGVLLAIVCQPAGIIAFVLMDQAKTLHRQGRTQEAQGKLASARLSMWIGAGVTAALILAYVVVIVVVIGMAAKHGH